MSARIFRVEVIVRERRWFVVEAATKMSAELEVLEHLGEGEVSKEGVGLESPRVVVEDVRVHDLREVSEEFRDHDAPREPVVIDLMEALKATLAKQGGRQ